MKGYAFRILLLLSVIAFGIPSFAQPVYKTVPDSMVCITPRQDIFFINQAFTIKEQGTTIVLQRKAMDAMYQETSFLRSENASLHGELDTRTAQWNAVKGDYVVLEGKYEKRVKGEKRLRIGLLAAISAALTEGGVIAILRLGH